LNVFRRRRGEVPYNREEIKGVGMACCAPRGGFVGSGGGVAVQDRSDINERDENVAWRRRADRKHQVDDIIVIELLVKREECQTVDTRHGGGDSTNTSDQESGKS